MAEILDASEPYAFIELDRGVLNVLSNSLQPHLSALTIAVVATTLMTEDSLSSGGVAVGGRSGT